MEPGVMSMRVLCNGCGFVVMPATVQEAAEYHNGARACPGCGLNECCGCPSCDAFAHGRGKDFGRVLEARCAS